MTVWDDVARVVADGVRLARGDRVSVFVTDTDVAEAVRAFVAEAYRRGAWPQVVEADERYERAALAAAPDEVLGAAAPLELAALGWSTKHVSFRGMVPPSVEAVDAARLALQRHGKGLVSAERWRQEAWALVRVPTDAWAGLVGLDPAALREEWAGACLQDWDAVRARLRRFCTVLDAGRELWLRTPDTDLHVPFAGRRWLPFAGERNFPDGEVATAPLDDGTEGHVTFEEPFWFGGTRIEGLRLDFSAGRVVDVRARQGGAVVRELLRSDEGASRVGEAGIGTNAAMTDLVGDLLLDEKVLGTAHVALGRAYPECGGVNRSALHWDIVKDLRGADDDLWLDGTPLVAGGRVVGPLAEATAP